MSELLALLSFAFGCLVAYLWVNATTRWRRARGLLDKPSRVAAENEKRMREARSDRSQGWRELLRSMLEVLLALLLVFLVVVLISGSFA